jgi:hypothetical protein
METKLRRKPLKDEHVCSWAASPDACAESAELQSTVAAAVRELRPMTAALVTARFGIGRPSLRGSELAAEFGLSEYVARKTLHAGLRILASQLRAFNPGSAGPAHAEGQASPFD